MNYEVQKLKQQVETQGAALMFLSRLLVRLLAETGDRAQVVALLEAEKVSANSITVGVLNQLIEAASPRPSPPA